MNLIFFLLFISLSFQMNAQEIALSFDDAPGEDTAHFTSKQRTDELIRKLQLLNVSPVIIFANPCIGANKLSTIAQLEKFKVAGNIIGNHTCTHPRIDSARFDQFTLDILKADELLKPLMDGPKLFRFPYFNEGSDHFIRDRMRAWHKKQNYRNILRSIDNEDPVFF